jgi:hypothetical protein
MTAFFCFSTATIYRCGDTPSRCHPADELSGDWFSRRTARFAPQPTGRNGFFMRPFFFLKLYKPKAGTIGSVFRKKDIWDNWRSPVGSKGTKAVPGTSFLLPRVDDKGYHLN